MDIDYSDLEAKFTTTKESSLDNFVVVDGAPVAPAAKVEALTKVLKKVLTKAGPLKEPHGFYMPVDDSGKTMGYAFLEFETPKAAREAIQMYNMKKLDAKHTLLVEKLSNIGRYTGDDVVDLRDPENLEFKPLPHLRSWLADAHGRDQAVLHSGDVVGVYWIRKDTKPQEAFSRAHMTETYVRWSPMGSFLVTLHRQGVALHAGPDFDLIGRFPHRDVRFVDFSPDERYLVTASRDPIPAVPEDSAQRATWPFKESDEGNQIVIWDTKTLTALRTFPMLVEDKAIQVGPTEESLGTSPVLHHLNAVEKEKALWPAFKWSPDSRFFARISAPDTLSIYETPSMALLDKKPTRTPSIADFEFAPAAVDGRQILVYWSPETPNQTARMCIMDVATKQIIRNRSLFNVSNCKIYWQNEGKYLCIKIDRLTKNKKSAFSSLEIYRLTDKAIPVEVIDLKEVVTNLGWEPKSDRFVCYSYVDVANQPMSTSKNIFALYAFERNKGNLGVWKEAYRLGNRPTNSLYWSPNGRFLVTGVIRGTSAKPCLEFWDVDHEGARLSNAGVGNTTAKDANRDNSKDLPVNLAFLNKVEENNFGMTDASWDPSGRYFASWSSFWRNGSNLGYKMWDMTGTLLRSENVDKFKAFLWRPRPASILPKEKRKEVNKNFKSYAAQFDIEDATRATEESTELQRKREEALSQWIQWRAKMSQELGEIGKVITESRVELVNGKVSVYRCDVIEEHEEIVS